MIALKLTLMSVLMMMLMLNHVADNDSVEVGLDVSANGDVDIKCC